MAFSWWMADPWISVAVDQHSRVVSCTAWMKINFAKISDCLLARDSRTRQPVPQQIFREGRSGSPAYRIEHDIDHSVSYVHGLVKSFIDGKNLDFRVLATKNARRLKR